MCHRREEERPDLLSALLALDADGRAVLSESEIVDNMKTFLFAGHDTTAAALTWALCQLAKEPKHLVRLYKEVRIFTMIRSGKKRGGNGGGNHGYCCLYVNLKPFHIYDSNFLYWISYFQTGTCMHSLCYFI
jgi:hypothetical protein